MSMISFDIFDTLVTRKTKNPVGIFQIMSHKLEQFEQDFSNYFCANFQYIRMNCETECRKRRLNSSNEITIFQIYETIQNFYGISNAQIQFLISLELETERENIISIDKNLALLKSYIESDINNVCLISDMYLSEEQLRYVLQDVDELFSTIPIYVSSDYKANKQTGLFERVFDVHSSTISDWTHFGDNYDADILSAKNVGISAEYLPQINKLDWEEDLFDECNLACQLLQGASKIARLGNHHNCIAYDIGASIGLSILFPYIKWVIDEISRMGIKDLFLLARDGFVLEDAFDEYVKKSNSDIIIHYLYGSRRAWKIPGTIQSEDSLLSIFYNKNIWGKHEVSVYANALGFSEVELLRYFSSDSLSIYDMYEPHEIAKIMFCSTQFIDEIVRRNTEKIERIRAYIRQETSDASVIALVDMQGTGITITYLSDIIAPMQIVTFYMLKSEFRTHKNCKFLSFMVGFDEIRAFILEVLTRALHGKTIDYVMEDGKYVPILDDDENVLLKEYGYDEYISGFNDAFHVLMSVEESYIYQVDWERECRRVLDYFYTTKSDSLLSWFGEIPFSDEILGKETIRKFAPILSEKQIEMYAQGKSFEEMRYEGICFPLSLRRIGTEGQKILDSYQKEIAVDNCPMIEKEILGIKNGKIKKYKIDLKKFKNGEKIILYGAGNVGKQLYNQLVDSPRVEVALWVDKAAFKYRIKDKMPVSRIRDIASVDFNRIIIAIASEKRAQQIITELVELGIDRKEIFWEDFFIE